jgi:hypothetical protein
MFRALRQNLKAKKVVSRKISRQRAKDMAIIYGVIF